MKVAEITGGGITPEWRMSSEPLYEAESLLGLRRSRFNEPEYRPANSLRKLEAQINFGPICRGGRGL